MPLPTLPLEIRARIFVFLDDYTLARRMKEVFWAMAPSLMQEVRLGGSIGRTHSGLVAIYPACGNYAHDLLIITNPKHNALIDTFLRASPNFYHLQHLRIVQHWLEVDQLPYYDTLCQILASSPSFKRLTLHNTTKIASLLQVISHQLVRLDLGKNPWFDITNIPLTPNLEILSFSPPYAPHFEGPRPSTLRTLIIFESNNTSQFELSAASDFLNSCPSVQRIGFVYERSHSDLFSLLAHLNPRIRDVCFKSNFGIIDNLIQSTSASLIHVSFKTCSFLFPTQSSEIHRLNRRAFLDEHSFLPTTRSQAQAMQNKFNLDSVLAQFTDGERVYQEGQSLQPLLQWVDIMDHRDDLLFFA